MKSAILIGIIAAFFAPPVSALDINGLNQFCAYRTPNQYECDVGKTEIIKGKRVTCARGLKCEGSDDTKKFTLYGTCQLNAEKKKGACRVTDFAGADGKLHSLSANNTSSNVPSFQQTEKFPDPAPVQPPPDLPISSSEKVLDAFKTSDLSPKVPEPPINFYDRVVNEFFKRYSSLDFPLIDGKSLTPPNPGEPGYIEPGNAGVTEVTKSVNGSPSVVGPAQPATGFTASPEAQQSWYTRLQNAWSGVTDFFTRQHICYGQPGNRCP